MSRGLFFFDQNLSFNYNLPTMLQSQLFTKTRKEAPKDEVSKNAELLIRGGFIHKEMAGVYSYLPLGLRVLERVGKIIREEMNAIGGQEVLLSALQNPEPWKQSNRWSEAEDVWFKTMLQKDTELGFGWTHEEPLTQLLTDHLQSYKDLPLYIYQIQNKFRNEARAKSGLIRGREFLMKDLYSFSRDKEEHDKFYEVIKKAYFNIFRRVGIGDVTYLTFASGGAFSEYSHEFQALGEAGEDTIYVDETKKLAVNKEVYTDEVLENLGLKKENLVEKKSIEVGNIFTLGTKFSDALNLNFRDEKGESIPVFMGSYGIGLGRLMGSVVEVLSDEKGIVWPESIAPFNVHVLYLQSENQSVRENSQELVKKLEAKNIEVLFDDREVGPGEKFAEADLIGIPNRIIVSEKTESKGVYEVKKRGETETSFLSESELFSLLEKKS